MTMMITTGRASEEARARFLAHEGEAFLLNDWSRVAFMHFEVDAAALQRAVPFELDLYRGRAIVSLVAFTMRRLRLRSGGKLLQWLTAPVANHGFLNVRTHVHHQGEPGIYFLAEYLPNPLSVMTGPRMYGLPFELGTLDFHHEHERGELRGYVAPARGPTRLVYRATLAPDTSFEPCQDDSFAAFMLERYTAFTQRHSATRRFRIWHEPWQVAPIDVTFDDATLLMNAGDWSRGARFIGAHYSPGARDVWMSRPRCINGPACDVNWPVERRP